ncbi:DMT family transporter [Microbulbifer magnicolonia]|uniref:DMT family transporter n=1 Tax=Microbulbifer magnicolonia TaxID=3109744 RepID=UPI002B403A1B|nr:DMT family transporter [Microbulbifer sp. GG15]
MVVPEALVYGLVLLSALAHAAWNAVVKHSTDAFLQLAMIRSVGLLTGLLLASQLPLPEAESLGFLLGGACCQYAYFFLLTRSYRALDYSTAYPIARGVTPLLVTGAALFFLDESLRPLQLTGVLLVSCGILALLLKDRRVSGTGILLSLATGIAIAGYTTLGAAGVRTVSHPLSFVAWLEILSGAGILLSVLLTQPVQGFAFARANILRGSTSGVIASGGFAVALWATSVMPVAAVAATRESSILFASVISVCVLKERLSVRRWIAALIIFTGIGALALA